MPNYHIPQDYFIKIYNESDSLKEVSMKTGLKEAGIIAKANRLRKRGIQLKRYIGGIKARVSDNEFIKIWNNATSLDEVMKLTKINNISGVHNRRRKLIKSGVYLKPIRKKYNQYTLSNEELVNTGFGYWFTGLVDGEGALDIGLRHSKKIIKNKEYEINSLDISLTICLRADDRRVLEYLYKKLECGFLSSKKVYNRDNPQFVWRVARIDDLLYRIIPILEICELQTKKREELALLKEAAQIKLQSVYRKYSGTTPRSGKRVSDNEFDRITEIILILRKSRVYKYDT